MFTGDYTATETATNVVPEHATLLTAINDDDEPNLATLSIAVDGSCARVHDPCSRTARSNNGGCMMGDILLHLTEIYG